MIEGSTPACAHADPFINTLTQRGITPVPADRVRDADGDGWAVAREIGLGHYAALSGLWVYGSEVRDQICQPLGPQVDVDTVWAEINPAP